MFFCVSTLSYDALTLFIMIEKSYNNYLQSQKLDLYNDLNHVKLFH